MMSKFGKFSPAAPKKTRRGPNHLEGWKRELQDLIDAHAGERVDGRTAAHRTRALAAKTLFAAFNLLHEELGAGPMPRNFKEQHVRKLVQHWYFTQEKQVNTIRTDLSVLRKFAGWIGKPTMVKPIEDYLPDVDRAALVVSATLTESKAWSTNGIDVPERLDRAFRLNERFGLILVAQITYGLRMKEALCLRPWKADNGSGLTVYPGDGPKGGRPRFIPYLIPEQAVIIKMIKDRVKKIHRLGWEKTRRGALATLESNTKEYYTRMEEIGITKKAAGVVGHGLRAEFAVNMARVKGFDPATEDYTGENPPWDELQERIKQVSELMGHSRPQIMASYFGAFKRDANGKVDYVGVAKAKKGKEQEDAAQYASSSAKTLPPAAPCQLSTEKAATATESDSSGNATIMPPTHAVLLPHYSPCHCQVPAAQRHHETVGYPDRPAHCLRSLMVVHVSCQRTRVASVCLAYTNWPVSRRLHRSGRACAADLRAAG
ncbi:integrase domain-containing protein [Paraburkholderia tuberum]|nr:integrase domain-containing protein [Paraburkholderia tuberum]